jgi:hypothetical protein
VSFFGVKLQRGLSMRAGLAIVGLTAALALLVPAFAQQTGKLPSFSTGFTPPGGFSNKPIDISTALKPLNINQSFRPPRPPSTFTLSNFFPKISVGRYPPKLPSFPNLHPLQSSPKLPFTSPLR